MQKRTDKAVELLGRIRGPEKETGLKIVKVVTTDPDPVTLMFEGSLKPLDLDIFEVPVSCYPLRKGDRFFTFPILGIENGQRWAVINKINDGIIKAVALGTTSCQVLGIGRPYTASDIINITEKSLQTGDVVILAPLLEDNVIKYVIVENY